MNLTIQIGRLVRDAEVRYTVDNMAIARFNIAVDRKKKVEGQPSADFFSCVAFGKVAEFIEKYFRKGSKIVITGELRNNNYTDRDGVKHYNTEILVTSVDFGESKKEQAQNEKPAASPVDAAIDAASEGEFMNIPDGIEDELPFN